EGDERRRLEQQPAEVAQPAAAVALAADFRIDPDLLDLHRPRRPRGGLGLEPDDAALEPDPRAAVLDLGARAPAEAVAIALERVDAELLRVRGGAHRDEELEVEERRRAQPGLARLRPLAERVDGLARTVLARLGHAVVGRIPELADRPLVADDHPRARRRGRVGEDAAVLAGRYEVRSDVAERIERAVAPLDGIEAPEAAPRDVLEEHALDRVARAEVEHLLVRRL